MQALPQQLGFESNPLLQIFPSLSHGGPEVQNTPPNMSASPNENTIEAQPNGAVETVPLKTRSIGLRFTIAI